LQPVTLAEPRTAELAVAVEQLPSSAEQKVADLDADRRCKRVADGGHTRVRWRLDLDRGLRPPVCPDEESELDGCALREWTLHFAGTDVRRRSVRELGHQGESRLARDRLSAAAVARRAAAVGWSATDMRTPATP